MKKIMLLPYAALLMAVTLGSCSLEKRVYRNGYHIEWNTAKNNMNDQKQTAAEGASASAGIQDESSKNNAALNDQTIADAVPQVKDAKPADVAAEQKNVPKKKGGLISRIIKDDTPEEMEMIRNGSKAAAFKSGFKTGLKLMMPDQETHTLHLAIASFVLGIISLFSYYGAFVLGLLAIIFGIIAIHKIRNSGGTYRGNTFAWLGLIFGIIAIIITTVYLKVY